MTKSNFLRKAESIRDQERYWVKKKISFKKQNEYKKLNQVLYSSIPSGYLIPDTNIVNMIDCGELKIGKLHNRFIIPKQVNLEFMANKNKKPNWYKKVVISNTSFENEKNTVDQLYLNAIKDVDFAEMWIKKKWRDIERDYGMYIDKLKEQDFVNLAEKLYQASELDRIIVYQALGIIGNKRGCILSNDNDITLFSPFLEKFTQDRIVVRSISHYGVKNLEDRCNL